MSSAPDSRPQHGGQGVIALRTFEHRPVVVNSTRRRGADSPPPTFMFDDSE